jgi:N-dimethylarginine dimethylaminohydrolase
MSGVDFIRNALQMKNGKSNVINPTRTTAADFNKIKNEFSDRIFWVSDQDANNFACNAVNIDNDVILKKASDELKAALSKNNFSVIEVDVSEFIKAGGACKCLTLEL